MKMTSTILEFLIVSSAAGAFFASLVRVLSIYAVREKARRVLYSKRLIDTKLHSKLQSTDPVKAEKAMSELRDIIKNNADIASEFSSSEKKTLRKILSDRAGAKYFLAL